jgi:Uncharacterised nucleotidyltransferase
MTSPEMDLLVSCAAYCVHGLDAPALRSRAGRSLHWATLVAQAQQHGVTTLLFRALDATSGDTVPSLELKKLRDRFQLTANGSLFLTGELLKLLRLFRDHNIAALPFKGPVLSVLLYDDPTFREFGDLDILVAVSDVVSARDLLLANGYVAKHLMEKFELYAQFGHELDLVRRDGNVTVDLQWRFASKWIPFPIDLIDLWQHLEPHRVGGELVPQPIAEDLLLLLCGHGYRHLWVQLKWIVDIAGFVNRYGETINWDAALKRAGNLGGLRIVLLGLYLAQDLLGANLHNAVKNAIKCDRHIGELGALVRREILEGRQSSNMSFNPLSLANKLQFHLKVRERWRDKLPNPIPMFYCARYWGQRYIRHYSRRLSLLARAK